MPEKVLSPKAGTLETGKFKYELQGRERRFFFFKCWPGSSDLTTLSYRTTLNAGQNVQNGSLKAPGSNSKLEDTRKELKPEIRGTPGWLSWLSVRLRLRS